MHPIHNYLQLSNTNYGDKPPSKCLKEEDDNPAILVSEASTTTLIADNFNEDQNLPITPTFAEQQRTTSNET